ncbi:hypothetical protein SH449x_004529 [Pirellulaceae bacterium SH449]
MLNQLSRIARRTALSSFLTGLGVSCGTALSQEPFILIPPSGPANKPNPVDATERQDAAADSTTRRADRPKQRIPSIPGELTKEPRSNEPALLEEPPLLRNFPGSSQSAMALDGGELILGKMDESADDVTNGAITNGAKNAIVPINDHLPVPRSAPFVREAKNPNVRGDAPARKLEPTDIVSSLSLSWQLANAAQTPFSPILLWQGIRLEPIDLPAMPDMIDEDSFESAGAGSVHTELADSFEIGVGGGSSVGSGVSTTEEAVEFGSKPTELETMPRRADILAGDTKKIRSVRIPFGDEDQVVAEEAPAELPRSVQTNSTGRSISLAELDEQKGQEAPIIDVKSLERAKDEQGADALRASKPLTPPKRQIKIDEPGVQGIQVSAKPGELPVVVSAADTQRLLKAQACLDHYLNFPESTSVRSPWAVMHALLPFGGDYEMVHGNQRVNAIGWMCHNGTCRTQRIFTPVRGGFVPNIGGGVQGHAGQFMAILAQCGVPLDYPIQVGAQKYTVEDLVRYEMATCREKSELTFKLIGLSYYLDSNKQWRSNDGKVWSIPKLIAEELAQPIKGAACGGTHRLMGFSFAVKQRTSQGLPIDGQYARADKFVREYVEYAWQLQNADGSFSTSWLEGRADEPNEERKVQTTGHILEWILFTVPDADVHQARVQKSIDFLLTKIYDKKEYKWPIGPRGHATRAVSLYLNRYDEIKSTNPELLRTQAKTAAPAQAPFSRR